MSAPDVSPSLAAPARSGNTRALRLVRFALPVVVLVAGVGLWELVVRLNDIKPYVLPAPSAVLATLIRDWDVLSQSLLTTLLTTFEGFAAAAIGGVALALLFNLSKWLEYSLFPYAVVLQVTPVIAIAPLLLIYLSATHGGGGLRLDRRLLSRIVQHDTRPEFSGSQPRRPVPALRRIEAANPVLSEITRRIAVHSRRPSHCRWPVVDRCRRGRDRGWVGRRGIGACLSNCGIRIPPQHSPNVRSVTVALGRWNCHLWAAGANLAPGPAALA